ncbi:MAG: DNA polymerase III subunit gamma/tau [Nitrospiraceae bacterium]|nr:DNA polymerase III subunit gamma/tau [Nitrospiraceae bacterium]
MSQFKSLARIYRPQTFSDLVGQEAVVRTLSQGFSSGSLTQAYLFSGERGVGKTTVARILAKAINCTAGPTATPCLSCSSCIEIAEGRSPDVLEMDGASHTSVEDVRTIREGLRYSPLGGKSRIIIIDEVHMLSTSAFNALLKTLEEPPPHVVFILATTEAHKIPDTVLSRCQHYRFRLLTIPEISGRIGEIAEKEGLPLDPGVIALVARSAEGSMRDALSLLDQILRIGGTEVTAGWVAELLGVTDQALEESLLSSLLSGDLPSTLRTARTVLEAGIDPRAQVRTLARLFRDILHSLLEDVPLDSPRYGWTREGAGRIASLPTPNLFFLEQALSVLVRGEDDLRRSPQPDITFELLLARICHLKAIIPLTDLLTRLLTETGNTAGPHPSSSPLVPRPLRSSRPPVASPLPPSPEVISPRRDPLPDLHPASGTGPLDLRIASDWGKALTRLSSEMRSLLESARVARFEQGTLLLDTGNSFFNNRIASNREALGRALSEAVRSPEPLRVETPGSGPSGGGLAEKTAPPPPLVSEAAAIFGSEIIGVRSPHTILESHQGEKS